LSLSIYSKNILLLFFTLITISFLLPSVWLSSLLMVVLVYIFYVYKSLSFDIGLLLFTLVLVLFNWTYLGVGQNLYEWHDLKLGVLVRVLGLGIVFIFYLKYTKRFLKIDILLYILFAIVIFSFLKSSDKTIAIQYLANVYIPLLFSLHIYTFTLSKNNFRNDINKFKMLPVNFILTSLILADFFFILLDIMSFIDLKSFYMEVGKVLRGEGTIGNFRTIIFGIKTIRIPGIFADPIVAGYALSAIFFFFFFSIRNLYLKIILLTIVSILIFITFSKGAYLMLTIGLLSLFIYKTKMSLNKKNVLIIGMYIITLTFTILRALQDGVTDSSAIHVLGLVLPFSQSFGINYFIGNDLGSGGNMGGWVEQGAESFIGLLMYNTGLIGVLIVIFIFFKLTIIALERKDLIGKFFIAVPLPVFGASFLQENSFNLSYTIPRIILFTFIILYFYRLSTNLQRNRTNENSINI
jgi:hypothetical protein